MRRFADEWDDEPEGFALDIDAIAIRLGLGNVEQPARPVATITRAVHAVQPGPIHTGRHGRGPVTDAALPAATFCDSRSRWGDGTGNGSPDSGRGRRRAGVVRRRARLVALDLRELGGDEACIERHLLRRAVHPAIAFEAARWAWSHDGDTITVGWPPEPERSMGGRSPFRGSFHHSFWNSRGQAT